MIIMINFQVCLSPCYFAFYILTISNLNSRQSDTKYFISLKKGMQGDEHTSTTTFIPRSENNNINETRYKQEKLKANLLIHVEGISYGLQLHHNQGNSHHS
jgi:hypothetical protein